MRTPRDRSTEALSFRSSQSRFRRLWVLFGPLWPVAVSAGDCARPAPHSAKSGTAGGGLGRRQGIPAPSSASTARRSTQSTHSPHPPHSPSNGCSPVALTSGPTEASPPKPPSGPSPCPHTSLTGIVSSATSCLPPCPPTKPPSPLLVRRAPFPQFPAAFALLWFLPRQQGSHLALLSTHGGLSLTLHLACRPPCPLKVKGQGGRGGRNTREQGKVRTENMR